MDTNFRRPDANTDPMRAGHSGDPSWWKDEHTSAWERVKQAFSRDWEQTKNDFSKKSGQDLDQGVGDTLAQATGQDPVPPEGVRNPPEADDFDKFDNAEPAMRYGYGAASYYRHPEWNDDLEDTLEREWNALGGDRPFDRSREAIRSGWERARGGNRRD